MKIRWLVSVLLLHLAAAIAWPLTTSCVVGASGVAFNMYDPIGGALRDSSGTITVYCNGDQGVQVSYTIVLTAGSGSYSARTISLSGVAINYNLYTDAARTLVWGDGTSGTNIITGTVTLTGSTTSTSHTVYGRIPASQTQARAGQYSDTLTVQLTY